MANYDDSHIYILRCTAPRYPPFSSHLPNWAQTAPSPQIQMAHRGGSQRPGGRRAVGTDPALAEVALGTAPWINPGPPPARRHLPLGQSSGGLGLKLYTSLWEGSCQPKSWPLSFGNSIRDKKELWTPTCSQMWPLLVSPSLCAKLSWPDKCAVGHGGHFQQFLS